MKSKILIRMIILGCLLAAGTGVLIAQKPIHPGILLYQQGKTDEAIRSLEAATRSKEFRDDAEVWNTLGLAYFAKDETREAQKSIEKAIKLAPNVAAYHGNLGYILLLKRDFDGARSEANTASKLDPRNTNALFILGRANLAEGDFDAAERYAMQIIGISPTVPDGYVLRSNVLVTRLGKNVTAGWDVRDEIDLLKQARDVLIEGAEKCRSHPNHKMIDDEVEAISAFYDHFVGEKAESTSTTNSPEPGITPLKILNKPLVNYTRLARMYRVTGVISIAVVFGADGKVRYTMLLNQLGFGLDEEAVRAAMGIRFVPQMKDGKPVSVVRTVEYSFRAY